MVILFDSFDIFILLNGQAIGWILKLTYIDMFFAQENICGDLKSVTCVRTFHTISTLPANHVSTRQGGGAVWGGGGGGGGVVLARLCQRRVPGMSTSGSDLAKHSIMVALIDNKWININSFLIQIQNMCTYT